MARGVRGGPGCRVLAVEDEPDLLQLVTLLLRRAGCDVTPACNGAEVILMPRNRVAQPSRRGVMLRACSARRRPPAAPVRSAP